MRSRFLLGGVIALGASPAMAADWSLYPTVSVSGVYNDNVRLTSSTGDEISVSGAELDAALRMRAEAPRSFFEITPRLRSTFFPSESEQEADDQFVRMETEFSTQRTRTSLVANWSHLTMVGSYFPSAAIGDDDVLGQPNPGEGVVQAGPQNNWQEMLEIAPAISFDFSERGSLELRLGYLDATYDVQVADDSEDFDATVGSLSYGHRLSQTARISLRGRYSTYSPAAGETTDAYGLDAEWSNRISDTSELFVRAGATQVESAGTDVDGGSTWDNGFTGGAGVRWAFEVSQIFLDLAHGLSPSSAGGYVTRDQVRAEWTRRITPMADAFLGARVITDSGPTGNSDFQDRTYASGTIGFRWRLARQWTLTGSYVYSSQDYENSTNGANSNAFGLGVVWETIRR